MNDSCLTILHSAIRNPNSAFPPGVFPRFSHKVPSGNISRRRSFQNDERLSVVRLSNAQARRLCYGSLKSHRAFSHDLIGKALQEIFPEGSGETLQSHLSLPRKATISVAVASLEPVARASGNKTARALPRFSRLYASGIFSEATARSQLVARENQLRTCRIGPTFSDEPPA